MWMFPLLGIRDLEAHPCSMNRKHNPGSPPEQDQHSTHADVKIENNSEMQLKASLHWQKLIDLSENVQTSLREILVQV